MEFEQNEAINPDSRNFDSDSAADRGKSPTRVSTSGRTADIKSNYRSEDEYFMDKLSEICNFGFYSKDLRGGRPEQRMDLSEPLSGKLALVNESIEPWCERPRRTDESMNWNMRIL